MPRLSVLFRIGLAVIAAGAVIAVAVLVPLRSARDIREAVSEGHSLVAANCWGCTPYDRLRSLFQLQEVASEPRIRQLERRLETPHLTQGERTEVRAALQTERQRLAAAQSARDALDDTIVACAADRACRRAPDAFHAQTCTGPWPTEATEARISSLARRIYASGAACREMPCPSVECGAQGQLQAMLEELTDTFAAYSAVPARGRASYAELAPVLADLRQTIERLPLVINETDEMTIAPWVSQVTETGVLEAADEWSNAGGPEVGWRLRMVRLQLSALASAPDLNWEQVAARAGAALAQVRYLEWLITLQDDPAVPCESARTEVMADLAGEMRRAAAALSICGARAGCGTDRAAPPLVDLYDRAPAGLGGLDRFTQEAVAVMARHYDALTLAADDPVPLSTDLERYGVGEAIRVSFGGTANRCIAEPGARLGMFYAGDSDTALEMRDVRATGDSNEALIAAPRDSGVYEIRAFASPDRGGGELARERIIVEPAPDGCEGFTGLWDTNFGELRLYARSGVVRGTYSRTRDLPPGFLTGEIRGPVLYGEWESELGEGGARLVLGDEGVAFRGAWSHIPGRYTGTGAWNGTCVTVTLEGAPDGG